MIPSTLSFLETACKVPEYIHLKCTCGTFIRAAVFIPLQYFYPLPYLSGSLFKVPLAIVIENGRAAETKPDGKLLEVFVIRSNGVVYILFPLLGHPFIPRLPEYFPETPGKRIRSHTHERGQFGKPAEAVAVVYYFIGKMGFGVYDLPEKERQLFSGIAKTHHHKQFSGLLFEVHPAVVSRSGDSLYLPEDTFHELCDLQEGGRGQNISIRLCRFDAGGELFHAEGIAKMDLMLQADQGQAGSLLREKRYPAAYRQVEHPGGRHRYPPVQGTGYTDSAFKRDKQPSQPGRFIHAASLIHNNYPDGPPLLLRDKIHALKVFFRIQAFHTDHSFCETNMYNK